MNTLNPLKDIATATQATFGDVTIVAQIATAEVTEALEGFTSAKTELPVGTHSFYRVQEIRNGQVWSQGKWVAGTDYTAAFAKATRKYN